MTRVRPDDSAVKTEIATWEVAVEKEFSRVNYGADIKRRFCGTLSR
jgi:hypothetical protein